MLTSFHFLTFTLVHILFLKAIISKLYCTVGLTHNSYFHWKKDHIVIYIATCSISQGCCEISHEITNEKVLWQL